MTHPDRLRSHEVLASKRSGPPAQLDTAVEHVRTFAALVHDRRGQDVLGWIE
ncbi:hypothetical protein [Streptomyces sp. ISL-44]|uniref:hypothetical protein n=1 Tax=Streptomyces sp. ISL-44 TaxID=2819184 RepID=UPI001BEAD046|nr:hypothetical protein [Streptomyces sp. ISL-44]